MNYMFVFILHVVETPLLLSASPCFCFIISSIPFFVFILFSTFNKIENLQFVRNLFFFAFPYSNKDIFQKDSILSFTVIEKRINHANQGQYCVYRDSTPCSQCESKRYRHIVCSRWKWSENEFIFHNLVPTKPSPGARFIGDPVHSIVR